MVGTATFRNIGNIDAQVAIIGNVMPADSPAPGAESESQLANKLWGQFLQAIDAMDTTTPNRSVSSNEAFTHDNKGPALTKADYDGFTQGTRTFYFVGTVRYTDATGSYHTDYCRFWNIRASGTPFTSGVHNEEHVAT